jgi:hypothetical protein
MPKLGSTDAQWKAKKPIGSLARGEKMKGSLGGTRSPNCHRRIATTHVMAAFNGEVQDDVLDRLENGIELTFEDIVVEMMMTAKMKSWE